MARAHLRITAGESGSGHGEGVDQREAGGILQTGEYQVGQIPD